MSQGPVLTTEVLVIGGGIAGLCAALEARAAGCRVLLVSKGRPGRSGNSVLAAGNISAAPSADPDEVAGFRQDILWAGRRIGDPELAKALAEDSAAAIAFLQQCGIGFYPPEQPPLRKLIPGHAQARTLASWQPGLPPQTAGLAMTLPLLAAAEAAGVEFIARSMALDLLVEGGRVGGAMLLAADGGLTQVLAGATVLASGGGGRLFANSNNTREMTGDGYALAYRAGAALRDLEFVQFHPAMGLEPVRTILPTTLFGDGAVLRNRYGEAFLRRSISGAEKVATRDEMSRAIEEEIQAGKGVRGGVFLDLSAISAENAKGRYRDLWDLLQRRGGDPCSNWPLVGVTVHFLMGGMVIDSQGRSTLEGLYGAGEVTGGLHGANRLGGNGLMEACVFGRRAGISAAASARVTTVTATPSPHKALPAGDASVDLGSVRQQAIELLWQGAGVVRCESGLNTALAGLSQLQAKFSATNGQNNPWLWAQTRNILEIGSLLLLAAARRKESRGAHYRSDYPAMEESWRGSLLLRRGPDGPHWSFLGASEE